MKAAFYTLVIMAAFTAQSTAFHFTSSGAWRPDFALLLAVYGGLRWGRAGGARFGALVGLLQDLLSYKTLGLCFFSKTAIGFAVGKLREKYVNDSPITRVIFVICAAAFDAFSYAALSQTFLGRDLFMLESADIAPRIAVNLVFAFMLLPAVEFAEGAVDRALGIARERFGDLSREG